MRTHSLLAMVLVAAITGCQQRPSPASNQSGSTASEETADPVAPDSFRVAFQTGKGQFVVQANRAWAPRGADRLYELVQRRYFDGVKFFRVLPNFVAQFGIHGDPNVNRQWERRQIPDDSVRESNRKGTLVFAMAGPNTRTTQLFINTRDNGRLDGMGFAPIGRVVEGLDVVEKLYSGYGEGAPDGRGPSQGLIEREGNTYLNRQFPRLDSIISARILP